MKPAALKDSVARADEMIRQAQAQRAAAVSAAVERPASKAAESADPPVQEEARAVEFSQDQTAPVEHAAPPPPADETNAALAEAEQRYRVLQGKYNAEVPRLNQEARAARAEAEQLRERLQQLEAEVAALRVAPKPAAFAVTDREREEYGEELLDAAARSALSRPEIIQLMETNARLTQQVAELQQQIKGASDGLQRTARQRMYDYLDAAAPSWRSINGSPEFLGWLDQEDGFSGLTRLDLLHRAFEANDAARVARFFSAFVDSTKSARPTKKVDPETLLSPGSGRSAAPAKAAEDKIIWTPESIAAFYRDVQKGVYRKDPETADRLERDIFAAQLEGRVAQ